MMDSVRLPYPTGAAPPRQTIVLANEDIFAVEAFEPWTVRIVVPSAIAIVAPFRAALVALGFYIVPRDRRGWSPRPLRRCGGALSSRLEAGVVDDNAYQTDICADEEAKKDEKEKEERNGSS